MNKKIALLFSSLLLSGFVAVQAQDQSSTTSTTTSTTTTETAVTTPAAPAVTEATAPAATVSAACEAKGKEVAPPGATCPRAHMKKCCHDVLTPEERHHFCEVKCKVLEANPSLKDKKKKHELCDAILKEAAKEEGKKPEETSIKPILDKLKKHCELEHQKKKVEQSAAASMAK